MSVTMGATPMMVSAIVGRSPVMMVIMVVCFTSTVKGTTMILPISETRVTPWTPMMVSAIVGRAPVMTVIMVVHFTLIVKGTTLQSQSHLSLKLGSPHGRLSLGSSEQWSSGLE